MSLPKNSIPRALVASVVGALVAWGGLVAMIFWIADAQGGIALLFSPFVAAPMGAGVGLCWLAYETPGWDSKAMLLLLATMVVSLPIGWLVSETMQIYGY